MTGHVLFYRTLRCDLCDMFGLVVGHDMSAQELHFIDPGDGVDLHVMGGSHAAHVRSKFTCGGPATSKQIARVTDHVTRRRLL